MEIGAFSVSLAVKDLPAAKALSTYSTKDMLGEELQGELVVYSKKKNGIIFSFDF